MDITIIKDILKKVVQNIVDQKYDLIYQDDFMKRVPVPEMRFAIEDYGGVFTMPPDASFDKMEIYEISENEVSVDCPLWSNNEQSDLTLIARVKNIDGATRYAVEDIHIL